MSVVAQVRAGEGSPLHVNLLTPFQGIVVVKAQNF